MSFQLLFVIPPHCNSEQDCSPLMVETFNAAIAYDIDAKWIKESNTNTDLSKIEYVVFEEFDGPFYKQILHLQSIKILSPLCLLQCIKMAKPIPNLGYPLASLALENCIVVCSCLPKESKKDLKNKVQSMAGLFSAKLVSDCTHLITNGVKSEKYNAAVGMDLKIMSVEFIDALWEASKTRAVHAYDEEFKKFKCPVFLNLNICSTGFTKNETLVQSLVQKHGGHFSAAMDVMKTDVLVCKSSAATSSTKYKAAVKHKIDCVTDDWIVDSVEKGYALPNVQDYAVKKATSTPTKYDDNVDPNFSQMSMIVKTMSQASETLPALLIEQTMNQSCITSLCGSRKKSAPEFDNLIENVDIKKAKMAGLFLDGCVIFMAGFKPEQKEKLLKILNFSGAVPCFTISDRITHAIIGSVKCQEFKQINSKNIPCAVVNVNWLIDSMNSKMPVDVDNYLIPNGENVASQSSTSATGSPLCKKGLSFLRTDVSILDVEKEQPDQPVDVNNDQDEDVLQHYMTSLHGRNSVDDALAAFTMNPVVSESHVSKLQTITEYKQQQNSATPNCKVSDTSKANSSSPSISITMDESVNACLAGLKFVVVNYLPEHETILVEQIKEMQGTVVPNTYKGIPDYAVVPIDNQSLQITSSHVVTRLWLADCFEQRRLITDVEYFHMPISVAASNVLRGLCITFSGLDKYEKEFLGYLVTQLGGTQQDWMSRHTVETKNTLATTHLITTEPSGKKYQGAIKWGLPVVNQGWLLECAETGRKVDEYDFIVGDSKENFKSDSSKIVSNVTHNATVHKVSTPVGTPGKKRVLQDEPGCQTPPNTANPGTCSQITPVNEIMARVRQVCGGFATPVRNSSPQTPNRPGNSALDDMPTPDTPYGACFQNPPPPELRKKWKRWIDKFPSPYKSPGTPLSEIKQKFWERYNAAEAARPLRNFDINVVFPNLTSPSENEALTNQQDELMAVDDSNDTENENLVLGQIAALESHMLSTAESSKSLRKSIKPNYDIPIGGMIPEKETQPLTVGWDENMVVAPVARPIHKHFMISGVDIGDRDSIVEKLENLGATFSSLSTYDPSSTHLLCDKLNRNEKMLASMASGLWILHFSYAIDSASAGKLLDERDYEFGNPKISSKFKLDSDGLQKATAAKYWREEIGRRGYGAFHDIRAIVQANKKEPMIRVLQAGGAVVVDASPPFDENVSATHCLLEVKNNDLTPYIVLAQHGVLCINTLYVNDFLQRTGQDINDFIIPAFRKYYE